MLAAVLNGKRRGTGVGGKQLILGSTEGAEDVLTASVFERIAYLPDSVFAAFLDELLALEDPLGELESISFWPSWSLEGQRVEPDVVLQTNTRTLLIEAKRWDGSQQQYAGQLARELMAGFEEDELGDDPILLTIGGLEEYSDEAVRNLQDEIDKENGGDSFGYELVCRSWLQVFRALQSAVASSEPEAIGGLHRLLSDIADVYGWHGLRTQPHRWLSDLKVADITNIQFQFGAKRVGDISEIRIRTVLNNPLASLPVYGITSEIFLK